MEIKVFNRKAIKISLIMCIVALLLVSALPMFSPIMSIIRQIIGACMVGWWAGKGIAKIWYK